MTTNDPYEDEYFLKESASERRRVYSVNAFGVAHPECAAIQPSACVQASAEASAHSAARTSKPARTRLWC